MEVETRTSDEIAVSEQAVSDFLAFLNGKDEYLDTGLGAFHTDNHSNW
ncbi:hypothetical protein VSQ48_14095 [Candidatus Ventrimonas sp. KK005]